MANRLAQETSPYLRQHADNPVDWYPWGAEALALARKQRRPILLSIGYSACHWCHVMAHESFEDEATARAMNELFVNVKVDREERPDLDRIYQLAHQALVRRGGGWPLTVFLTPGDLMPFFAGTYFPREARYGMPSFQQVLQQVRDWYDNRTEDIREQSVALRGFLDQYLDPRAGHGEARERGPITRALARYEQLFDARYGGFGQAPKFPHTGDLELVAHEALNERDEARRARLWHLVEHTLTGMAAGGIHDQLGGGFCRYSVDARWAIPHFEKMLYDNALLLPLFARAARVTRREAFASAARGIVTWMDREMRAPGGGWYAALDADSEGQEGRYYLWQRDQVRDLLTTAEWDVARRYYGFDLPPNYEDEAWNPCVVRSLPQLAIDVGLTEAETARLLDGARTRLLAQRATRVRPGTDDKVLTAWNALMIAGLARAARLLADPTMLDRAEAAMNAMQRQVWREDRLYASFQGGAARHPGYLDDYAFALDALMELLRSRWHSHLLAWAATLADALLQRFEDRANGGFFFTAHDHEALIARPKSYADEALPSGNGVAARALLRLGRLVGETRWLDAAQRTLDAGWGAITETPHGCATMLIALGEALQPPLEIVIRLSPSSSAGPWTQAAERLRARNVVVYLIPPDGRELPGHLAERRMSRGGAAYVCEGTSCLPPVFSPDELVAMIET